MAEAAAAAASAEDTEPLKESNANTNFMVFSDGMSSVSPVFSFHN